MDGLVVEKSLGHIVHVVMQLRIYQIVGNHGVEHRTLYLNAVIAQHLHVVLNILSDFQCFLVFIDRFEYVY